MKLSQLLMLVANVYVIPVSIIILHLFVKINLNGTQNHINSKEKKIRSIYIINV